MKTPTEPNVVEFAKNFTDICRNKKYNRLFTKQVNIMAPSLKIEAQNPASDEKSVKAESPKVRDLISLLNKIHILILRFSRDLLCKQVMDNNNHFNLSLQRLSKKVTVEDINYFYNKFPFIKDLINVVVVEEKKNNDKSVIHEK